MYAGGECVGLKVGAKARAEQGPAFGGRRQRNVHAAVDDGGGDARRPAAGSRVSADSKGNYT